MFIFVSTLLNMWLCYMSVHNIYCNEIQINFNSYIIIGFLTVICEYNKDMCLLHLLQVVILQENLEEKDQEIERLKQELHQKSIIEEEKTDSPSKKKETDEGMISGEPSNWVIICSNFVRFNYFVPPLFVVCTLNIN